MVLEWDLGCHETGTNVSYPMTTIETPDNFTFELAVDAEPLWLNQNNVTMINITLSNMIARVMW